MTRLQKVQVTLSTSATNNTIGTGTTKSLSGFIRGIKVKSPAAVDTSATLTTTIADEDSDAIGGLASGFTAQAVNTVVQQFADTQTQPNPLMRPVCGALTITGTLSANQTTPRTVIVTLYVESYVN